MASPSGWLSPFACLVLASLLRSLGLVGRDKGARAASPNLMLQLSRLPLAPWRKSLPREACRVSLLRSCSELALPSMDRWWIMPGRPARDPVAPLLLPIPSHPFPSHSPPAIAPPRPANVISRLASASLFCFRPPWDVSLSMVCVRVGSVLRDETPCKNRQILKLLESVPVPVPVPVHVLVLVRPPRAPHSPYTCRGPFRPVTTARGKLKRRPGSRLAQRPGPGPGPARRTLHRATGSQASTSPTALPEHSCHRPSPGASGSCLSPPPLDRSTLVGSFGGA